MNRQRRLCLAAALLALPGVPARAGEKARLILNAAPLRIVLQVNESNEKKWMEVLANLRNMQRDAGSDKPQLAVVVIGAGLDMLLADSIAANDIQDALATGVEFLACQNSMQARHLDAADLVDKISYTKAGYLELARRQQQGWTYLRP